MSRHSASWYLIIRKGSKAGRVYPLRSGTMTIGRHATNHIVIDDPRISRHHVRLTWQGNSPVLEDLASANGTAVNNVQITSPRTLNPGDSICLGQEVLMVLTDQAETDKTIYDGIARVTPMRAAQAPLPSSLAAAAPTRTGYNWLAFGLGGMIATAVLAFIIIGGVAIYYYAGNSSSAAVLPTSTPSPTTAPTYTPYPTYSPVPTQPPTYTPYPTYTPQPTDVPTATPYPTYTPYPTQVPSATPYPTYTPYPTPIVRQLPSQPTDTPVPTATPPPPYSVTLGKNVHYEPWGNPADPIGCKGPYDDRIEVRRFYAQALLTNNSNRFISEGWGPVFISASGASLPSCVFYYDNLVVEPGETIDVTYGTHLQKGDWVKALLFDVLGHTQVICLNPGGQVIICE